MDDKEVGPREEASGKKRTGRPAGRPPLLNEGDLQVLVELIVAEPQAPVRRLRERMRQECGKKPSRATVWKAMRLLDISKETPQKPTHKRRTQRPAAATESYRYRAPHRREPCRSARRYPSDLTDAEWAQLESLLEGPGPTGRPPVHSRRRIVDALLYVLRSGCPWRYLPLEYPPWQTVYSCFRRWKARDTFQQLQERLRDIYRQEQGREAQPSAGIVDSQSVKTTEKGGPGATMRARKSKVASATCSSIRWA